MQVYKEKFCGSVSIYKSFNVQALLSNLRFYPIQTKWGTWNTGWRTGVSKPAWSWDGEDKKLFSETQKAHAVSDSEVTMQITSDQRQQTRLLQKVGISDGDSDCGGFDMMFPSGFLWTDLSQTCFSLLGSKFIWRIFYKFTNWCFCCRTSRSFTSSSFVSVWSNL